MAENKKSFVLYADLKHTLSKVPDEVAGKLFKLILEYVNDENPTIENDLLLEVLFEPIKQTLKRDLMKWDAFRSKQSENGKKGGRPKNDTDNQADTEIIEEPKINQENPNNPSLISESQKSLSVSVNDTASVSVPVNENVTVIKNNTIEDRKLKFATTLKPFVEKYGRELINEFYKYWTEPNKSNTKFRQEMQKTWSVELRLETWVKNDFGKKEKSSAQKEKDQSKFSQQLSENEKAKKLLMDGG